MVSDLCAPLHWWSVLIVPSYNSGQCLVFPLTLLVFFSVCPLHWTVLCVLPLIGGQCSMCSLMLVVSVQCAPHTLPGSQCSACPLALVDRAACTPFNWWSVLRVQPYVGGQCSMCPLHWWSELSVLPYKGG